MKIKAFIVTLFSRAGSLKKLVQLCKGLGIEYECLKGIRGSELKLLYVGTNQVFKIFRHRLDKEAWTYDPKYRKSLEVMTYNEVACAMNHLLLYESLVRDESHDAYLILEDDAELLGKVDSLCKTLRNLPQEFEMLHLGVSDYYPFQITGRINSYFFTFDSNIFFNRTTAYVMSKTGAKIIQQLTHNFRLVLTTSDDLLANLHNQHPKEFRVYVPVEPLFHEPLDTLSLIFQKQVKWSTLDSQMTEEWLFFKDLDSSGHDVDRDNEANIQKWFCIAKEKNYVAFNSLGFFKAKVVFPLEPSPYFGPEDGIFIRKDVLSSASEVSSNVNYLKTLCISNALASE